MSLGNLFFSVMLLRSQISTVKLVSKAFVTEGHKLTNHTPLQITVNSEASLSYCYQISCGGVRALGE